MEQPSHARAMRAGSAILVLLLAGCAQAPPAEPPRIERLTGAALEARIPAPAAAISLDELAAMAQRGESAEAMIAKLDATHSRYRLNAGQLATLLAKRVPPPVIDHVLETERRSIFDEMATEITRREQACHERFEQELRQCRLQALQPWPAFADCWPPHAGFPYWRCF